MRRVEMRIDGTLASIVELRDALGVLSIYVDADPAQEASQRPAWVVATRTALHELVSRAKADGERDRRFALEACLERIEPRLEELLDARRPGRGRALFARLAAKDGVESVSLQLPLPNAVRLNERAYLRPLVAAAHRGRPAGLVAVSRAGLRAIEQRYGAAQEVAAFDFEVETGTWRDLRGPAFPNPARGQQTVSQRDRFERRVEEHQFRELHAVVADIATAADGRGWDRVVVSGDPHLRAPLVEALVAAERQLVVADRDVAGLSLSELAAALAPELESASEAHDRELVGRAVAAARSGGPGAVGVADVLSALQQGRVAHLVLDGRLELRGSRGRDGTLAPAGVDVPGTDDLKPVDDLVEPMIEQAVETDAGVSLLDGAPADLLRDVEGAAAVLRW